ncbi:MAG: M48 family metallopeptidase [Verrucomicrobia bacterium]|nr:M48 family metallopeptidase [Verrucomicrobiota bacterium]MCG2680185.1 M48 family metallopeptidase [Kiritimatiellia bacterium]MBU4247503.1 M48 family metallopeptidase [Verrucomicrobiota bacterium]MBU4289472.1 M48 family metallopeptidase [Verrucomicrobiota bacterium]MBU4429637.1 M48 family metallopeptidase [Verrucomicrobiota bacterium]
MDFFEHQDRARRKTSLLIGYFILAVTLIIMAVYGVFALVFIWLANTPQPKPGGVVSWWNPELFLWVITGTVLIVVIGSLYKIIALSRGGEAVAAMLGARPVPPNATDVAERRLLNVVEEMAIAAGIPVPRVFLLEDEDSINAFAAGFSPTDAIIGVTRGCMTLLTRDELQGVVAHEFSHILNGDMRLNLRLMGILHGILVIALIGYMIFRLVAYSSTSRSASAGKKKGGGLVLIMVLGLGLMVIGYIGVFFAKLIKSALSRQREFLADAAAVQFTRNPDGLGGALKKIGGFLSGSRIENSKAEEASHLFFADGLRASFFNLMATHPPLAERIRRIDASFDGGFTKLSPTAVRTAIWNPAENAGSAPGASPVSMLAEQDMASGRRELRSEAVTQSIGRPQAEHLLYASTIMAAIPPAAQDIARDPVGARALIYCLLLNKDTEPRNSQLAYLQQHCEPPVYQAITTMQPSLQGLAPELRLPLADLALATLRSLSKLQFTEFKDNLHYLITADNTITLFEYALQRSVVRHLESLFNPQKSPLIQYYAIKPLLPSVRALLSTLAYYGHSETGSAEAAFQLGADRLKSPITLLPRAQCGLQPADRAIEALATTSPQIKKMTLDACAACIGADGRITVAEAELLRAIADSLGCPVPPVLPGRN